MGRVGNLRRFLFLRLSVQQLSVVLIMAMLLFSVSECDAAIEVKGTVGGSVIFNCTEGRQQAKGMLYLQKGQEFVNGFYLSKNITMPKWKNTRVCCNDSAVHMDNLNASHEGLYTCIFRITNNLPLSKNFQKMFKLRLTAPYSKPTVTHNCDNVQSCHVKCSAHGGYPRAIVMWNVTETGRNRSRQRLTSVNSSEEHNPDTLLFNCSNTVYCNCSGGELKLSCSVAGSTSNFISICVSHSSHEPSTVVIAVVICVAVVILFVVVICLARKKKPPEEDKEEPRINENGETLLLNPISSAPPVLNR